MQIEGLLGGPAGLSPAVCGPLPASRGRQRYASEPMSPLAAAVLAGLLGLAFGSFANVVIHRVPRGESVVRAGSRCPSCGQLVAWRDNLPVVGWLLLRGRCRHCRAPVSARYPLVELGMGILWFLLTLRLVQAGLGWAVPAYLALAFICVVLAVIDASTRLLPNRITYPAFPVVLGLLLVASLGLGDLGRLGRGLLAAVAVGGFFLALALISPGGMGLGDVKLAPTLGLALGWLSWGAVAFGVFAGFLLGGLAGLAAIAVLGLTRKSLLPFGPWLVAGALLGVLAGADVAAWCARSLLGS
jgi:leader peptidase (prepilin peptidase) / N-methyltransferase